MTDIEIIEVLIPGTPVAVEVPIAAITPVDIPTPGPQGAQGEQGESGVGDNTYLHEQDVPSTAWTVAHNMGKYPSVVALAGGVQIEIEVEHIDDNNLIIHLANLSGGIAQLN